MIDSLVEEKKSSQALFMERYNSKGSVGSIESSRGGRKKEAPTHMIIQRDGSNELLLLPVSNLVNGGLTRMKLNEKATFKVDLAGRKQERGVIISFGIYSSVASRE